VIARGRDGLGMTPPQRQNYETRYVFPWTNETGRRFFDIAGSDPLELAELPAVIAELQAVLLSEQRNDRYENAS
jgi:hypothetical protein